MFFKIVEKSFFYKKIKNIPCHDKSYKNVLYLWRSVTYKNIKIKNNVFIHQSKFF